MLKQIRDLHCDGSSGGGWQGNPLMQCVGLILVGLFVNATLLHASEPNLVIRSLATPGLPYGVGFVELDRKRALELGWYSDQSIQVKSSRSKILLPAVDDVPTGDSLLVYFLFSGGFPAEIEISIADSVRFRARMMPEKGDSKSHSGLLKQWWVTLGDQSQRGISPALARPSDDFLAVLGRHLELPFKRRIASKIPRSSQLESQFERTLGMLLGFESVRLAMMVDDTGESIENSPATEPLPSPINIESVRIPEKGFAPNSNIEAIASMVPSDCFYVRCKSIRNYSWLRQLLLQWGGSLDEIVTSPSIDSDVRGRIETQLGINAQHSMDSGLDKMISDMAVIGSDVFFEEGAGIGVLLEAHVGSEKDAEAMLQKQRNLVRKDSHSVLQSEKVQGHFVSFLGSKDHRVRSFLVRKGRYVLVTNSRDLIHAFLSLGSSTQSLADLKEYRYAHASHVGADVAEIKFYLSDPFFRRITGPSFRTELSRRRNSARDCRTIEIAAIVAKALGHPADSIKALASGGFLPADFGRYSDGSRVDLIAAQARDSMRGKAGTFIPVADIKPDKVNRGESQAYQRFSQRYRKAWPSMDPVLATIHRELAASGIDRIHLNIHVTPYARSEYGFLANYLAEPTLTHAAMAGNEPMGVSAHLHNHSQKYLAHLGLVDASIPFHVSRGELKRNDESPTKYLTQEQSFAAVSPAGLEGLQLVSGLVKSLQTREAVLPLQNSVSQSFQPQPGFNPFWILRGIMNPGEPVVWMMQSAARSFQGLSILSSISEDPQWSIYGGNVDLRLDVRQRLSKERLTKPAQIHVHLGDIEQTALAPYLHAYSYCAARQQSAADAVWLNRWTEGLAVPPAVFRNSLEHAIQGKLKCPLGGEFIYQKTPQSPSHWTSTAWNEQSLAKVNDVPSSYRFPFLTWLKRVDLDFNLTPTSLSSEMVLDVASQSNGN